MVELAVMDENELLQQLNHFYKVRLYLDEDKRELLMHKHQSASLLEPVLEALEERREPLLKRNLFVDALARFDRWMDERAEQVRLGSVDLAKARLAGQGARSFLEALAAAVGPNQPTLSG